MNQLLNLTLPSLPYDYSALEPFISAQIMETHHLKHHGAYVNNLKTALASYEDAKSKGDLEAMLRLEPMLRFHGGGHLNHTLFWQMLAPVNDGGGRMPHTGAFFDAVSKTFGSMDALITRLSQLSLAIQGSGWGWLAYDPGRGLILMTCANQDPVSNYGVVGLLGIDVWEHAYYLQYKQARADYLKQIWHVVNWSFVEQRFDEAMGKKL